MNKCIENYIVLTSDNASELLGTFHDIEGLCGDRQVTIDDENYHEITLIGTPADILDQWCVEEMEWPDEHMLLELNVYNKDHEVISSYYIDYAEPSACKSVNIVKNEKEIKIIGFLRLPALPSIKEIWALWYDGMPVIRNEWSKLSYDGKRAWLRVVGSYWGFNKGIVPRYLSENLDKQEVHLDGKYIVDYPSLYCAIGEAVNGAGGYYGSWEYALDDCMCGGCGPIPPFKLIWHDSDIAQKSLGAGSKWLDLVRQAELNDRKYRLNVQEDEIDLDIEEVDLFSGIIDTFKKHDVEVELL